MSDAVADKPQAITSRHDPRYKVTLYEHVGVENAWTLDYYLGHEGYQAAKKALTTMQPEEVVNEVKKSGLRGRGGAGFPTGVKWSFMPKPDGRQRFILCNGDESEPGSFKDRYILEDDPHQLVEGLIIAGYAMHATIGIVYIRGEYHQGYERLVNAVKAARAAGYVGKDIFGSGFDFDIIIHRGAGAYICGEETALMNSFEGLRGNPRMKPPFPAQAGVYGRPTTINNVTSITSAVHIIKHGADWFASMGTEDSKGTKLYQVSGCVNRPGVYEMPMGATFGELIYDFAGGLSEDAKAFIPGGSSTPLMPFTEEYLSASMSYDGIAKKGSMLGTGGVIVIPKEKCIVNFMWNCIRFYGHESCGKCTPCREGVATWMPKMFQKLVMGRGEPGDLELIETMSNNIKGTGFCVHADAAMWPIDASIKYFRDEYEYLIEHGVSKYPRTTWWKD